MDEFVKAMLALKVVPNWFTTEIRWHEDQVQLCVYTQRGTRQVRVPLDGDPAGALRAAFRSLIPEQ